MSDVQPSPPPPAAAATRSGGTRWSRHLVLGLVAAIGLVVLAVVFYTAVPRWWAQRAADQVDGSLSTGLVLGFMYGFLCTLLPLAVLWVVYRYFRRRPLAWLIGLALALLLAGPNLVTLWIAVGTGGAVHAADRTLDVRAPWFRGGMVIGVAVALAFVAYVVVVNRRERRRTPPPKGKGPVATSPKAPPP
jgi:hypothetical protein